MDAESHVTVGAIMPTYNQAEFFRAALLSMVEQVDETVVVDDGSDCEGWGYAGYHSAKAPKKTHVICHETNRGTAEAINTGARWMCNRSFTK